MVADSPAMILVGVALQNSTRVCSGFTTTVTTAVSVVLLVLFFAVIVYVVVTGGCTFTLPVAPTAPIPLMVTESAFCVLHCRFDVPPAVIVGGLAMKNRTFAGGFETVVTRTRALP